LVAHQGAAAHRLHIGCDVRTASDATIALLTNAEVLAVNQDALGVPGRRVWSSLGPWAAAGPFARLFNWAGGIWSGRAEGEPLYIGSLSLRGAAALCEAVGPECAGFAFDAGAPPPSVNGTTAAPVRLFRSINSTNASLPLLRGVFSRAAPDRPAGSREVWAGPLSNGDVAVVLFNRGVLPARITARWSDVGLARGAAAKVRDLWAHAERGTFTGEFSEWVPGHGVVMLRLSPVVAAAAAPQRAGWLAAVAARLRALLPPRV
jgi:hypothetical protein